MNRPLRIAAHAWLLAIIPLLFASPAEAQTGKCCTPDGRCFTRTQEQCASIDGAVFDPSSAACESSADTCSITPPATGACCTAAGGCSPTVQSACGGTWQSGTCSPSPCPAAGACCIASACSSSLSTSCTGTFIAGGSCSPDPCAEAQGKCCTGDGRCFTRTQAQCTTLGGLAWVAGAACQDSGDTCGDPPLNGACCEPGGACAFGLNTACPSTSVFHPNLPCSATACTLPSVGACCESFACRTTVAADCTAGTFFTGAACSTNFCGVPPTAVCCKAGICSLQLQAACISAGGEWFAATTSCSASFCTLGACCLGPLSCVFTSQPGCEQGSWIADGTCVPTFCGGPYGSCCRDSGQCVVTLYDDCTTATYIDGGTCASVTCQTALGACCSGSTCTTTAAAACSGTFAGPNSSCGTPGNPIACCPANFDHTGGLAIQDIFDYLNAWFAGDARADFDGGGLAVSDIFAFLNAWFAGCS